LGPGEVIATEGAIAALRVLLASRVAVVVSRRGREDAAVARWLAAENPYEVAAFTPSWAGEPSLEGLTGTLAELDAYRPDWIVAIGGGRVLDGAKLCWALHEHPGFPRERLGIPFALPPLRALCRFAVVPTTAATGSEASSSATFDGPDHGAKLAAVTHDFLPDVAILDPRLLQSLSPAEVATGALDALGHAVEGYTSKLNNPMVDVLAEGAVATLIELLTMREATALAAPDLLRLQIAACHAGQVQNLRLVGYAHALAHQLARFGIPHAIAVGLLLPQVMRRHLDVPLTRSRYDRLARAAGLADADALIAAIASIPGRFGIAPRLGDWTREAANDFDAVGTEAAADGLSRFAPAELAAPTLTGMVRAAW
jgi:alcohol dehydrogenase class IV